MKTSAHLCMLCSRHDLRHDRPDGLHHSALHYLTNNRSIRTLGHFGVFRLGKGTQNMQLSASRLSCTVPGTGAFRPSRQLSSYSSQFIGGLHAKHWHRQAPARGSGCRRTAVRAGLPIPIVGEFCCSPLQPCMHSNQP